MTALELLATASSITSVGDSSLRKGGVGTEPTPSRMGQITLDETVTNGVNTAAIDASSSSHTTDAIPSTHSDLNDHTNNNSNSNSAARSGGHSLQFPWKLHEMLDLAERNGQEDVISWLAGGKGFRVHKKDEFCVSIMPSFFSSTKYKTFQRSLNLWGFESVSKGRDRGACYHRYFLKGQPDLCHHMTRIKIKGQTGSSSSSPSGASPGAKRSARAQTVATAHAAAAAATALTPPGGGDEHAVTGTPGVAGIASSSGSDEKGGRRPSLVSAFIRGKTYQETMASHHQAAALLAGPAGLGFMGGANAAAAGLMRFPHPGLRLGPLGFGAMDPTFTSLYGAELMARRASLDRLERHHAMSLAAFLSPQPTGEQSLPGQGNSRGNNVPSLLSSMDESVRNGILNTEPESAELAKARAAELTASATRVLQL